MAGGRKFPIVTLAVMVLLLTGTGLAWLVWLPLPEERVQNDLSEIRVRPIGVVRVSALVDHLNAEIENSGKTSYRVFLAKEQRQKLDTYDLFVDSGGGTAFECIKRIKWFTELPTYYTAEGIVFDVAGRQGLYPRQYPLWRKTVRDWIKCEMPAYPRRLWEPRPVPVDPFAPPP
jgi:hypothetical protein